jgi:arylsulfatase A-like enzyme
MRAAAIFLLAAGVAFARVLPPISSEVADYAIAEGPPVQVAGVGTTSLRVGSNTNSPGAGGRNAVFIFALPVLAPGENITSAQLTFHNTGTLSGTAFNGDLWGIGFRSSTNPVLSYFEGDSGDPRTTNIKIEDDVLVPGLASGSRTTTENAALGAYLRTFYQANPQYSGGSFVFLRLNPDADAGTGSLGWSVGAAEGVASTLTITTDGNPPEGSQPNFLFLITDDQRYDAMGVVQREKQARGEIARFPWFETPNMDRLAAGGVRFRNAFVTLALCSPSRAAYLTGRHNHLNGVVDNNTAFPGASVTWATLLRDAGYRTGYIGKWHHGSQSARPGFEAIATYNGQGSYFGQTFTVSGIPAPTQFHSDWVDDKATDYALSFIDANADRRWALVVGYKTPHGPFTPAARNAARYETAVPAAVPNLGQLPPYKLSGSGPSLATVRDIFRGVYGVDENLGRLLDRLDARNLTNRTVVVYCSDNGYYLGEHRLGDKRSAYEESIRIPLLVRYPPLTQPGTVRDEMALNIDLAPTFLDLAGLAVPPAMQGRSWRPLLAGGPAPRNWRKHFLYEYYLEDGSPNSFPQTPSMFALRTETDKMIHYPGREWWDEVFHLSQDPYETRNVRGQPASREIEQSLSLLLKATLGGSVLPRATQQVRSGTSFATTWINGGRGPHYRAEASGRLGSPWTPLQQVAPNAGATLTISETNLVGAERFHRWRMIAHPSTQPGQPQP